MHPFGHLWLYIIEISNQILHAQICRIFLRSESQWNREISEILADYCNRYCNWFSATLELVFLADSPIINIFSKLYPEQLLTQIRLKKKIFLLNRWLVATLIYIYIYIYTYVYTRVFARFARKTTNTVCGTVDVLGAVDIFAQGHKRTLMTWKIKIIYLILYYSQY